MAVTNDLVTDRRVARHCAALREAGYEVTAVGQMQHMLFHRGAGFYAEYNIRLLLRLLTMRADIVWANDTDTLPACRVAARLKGCRLVMDAHELFPEVPELVGRERVKRVWEWFERKMMPKADALFTVCQSIADYYAERYSVKMTVVRNLNNDVWTDASKSKTGIQPTKLLLYQGCVNMGRGVDWAIDALEWLEDCRLVVAGGGDLLEEMKTYAASKPWADRISFTGRLNPEKLMQLTAQADVGLVMLEDLGLSYHYALPNRIGDFVAARVPMVVSDLPEMATVIRRFGIGEIISGTGAGKLAEAVKKVLAREWKAADFDEARKDMDWDKEKQKLINTVKTLNEKTQ